MQPYATSLSLLTDLYQLTMAYGYWKNDLHEHEAVFHLTFRRAPFGGAFALCAGLAHVIDFLESFSFDGEDLAYLAGLQGNDDLALFEPAFLSYLAELRFSCDIDAIEEGQVVFAHEPLVRVRGPLLQAQLIETALLNMVNFQTLIATKAARVCWAAQGEPVLEFGLRRAQGIDGGLSVSRAAYIGGCIGTSNVLAGRLYGVPVKGTHAHSWVMSFDAELDAFRAYARAMPNNCVFLVDTYDTVQGVRRAIEVGHELRAQGFEMLGIRLDSGDLAELSKVARRLLDEAGFPQASIVASNDLDERIIQSLKNQGARIGVWGVGTNLATAKDQPALGGVYKLAALRAAGEEWKYRIKLSEQTIKVSNPGIQDVVRHFDAAGCALGDVIHDHADPRAGAVAAVLAQDSVTRFELPADTRRESLLQPIFRAGARVYQCPELETVRQRALQQLAVFPASMRRFENPALYRVGLSARLHGLKLAMVEELRQQVAGTAGN